MKVDYLSTHFVAAQMLTYKRRVPMAEFVACINAVYVDTIKHVAKCFFYDKVSYFSSSKFSFRSVREGFYVEAYISATCVWIICPCRFSTKSHLIFFLSAKHVCKLL